MKLTIKNNGCVLTTFENVLTGTHNFECELALPALLQFEISGKNYNTDTKVIDGEIVNDKFVQLTAMTLGRIPIKQDLLYTGLCSYQTDQSDTISHHPFWGFNGNANIDISEASFIKYHLVKNNIFDY